MANHLKLYLFGDQTYDIRADFKNLLWRRDNPVLTDFLAKSYNAIRVELYTLPPEVRDDLRRFTCLEDLAFWDQNGKRCIPLDMAVTCMYQLGAFISDADPWNHGTSEPRTIGLCMGTLSAAAVSCSRSTQGLVPLAVDAVTVAFKTGIRVNDAAKTVAPSQDSDECWSVIVPGSTCSEAINKFCEQSLLPLTSRPYISAYLPSGTTVSGPPKTLAQFVHSQSFKDLGSKSVPIPIYGPYHAPHLYSSFDVSEIVGSLAANNASACSEQIPFFSSSGLNAEGRDFTTLLEGAVAQILLQPIQWGSVHDQVKGSIQDVGPKSFSVVPIGSSADQLLYNMLEQTPFRSLVSSAHTQRKHYSPREFSKSSGPKRSKLAIVGISGRFPGAQDNEAFWDLLYDGLDVHRPVPALHWNSKTHVDPTASTKNTSATPFGCWLDEPAVFDARFFNISPREAPQIDPAQRLALMTAYEAIEQAGLVPDATPSTRRDRVGVFYGVTSNDWMETNSAQNIDTYFIPGGNRAFIPGRINYCFKFSGPSYAVDTACSSSLAGIHLACNSLWQGDIDTAITGGTNVLTNPDFTAGLDRGHFLSRTGNCKTFDDEADGYCRGEGIGSIIIKRLEDALADNDPILGTILGAYTNHSAESESITRPHVGAQRAIFSKVLNESAVNPFSVGYVEMHGTGTQAGDAGEMSSVVDTFAPPRGKVERGKMNGEALYIGSAKANIGHGEAASGVTSLIKVLLMMQKNTIVPHCGIKTKINRKFPIDLQDRNVKIALKPTPWARSSDPARPRRVFVNNFSAAGGNTALLLEDAPFQHDTSFADTDPRNLHLIAISAKVGKSLQGNLRSLLEFLKQNPRVSVGQLSYTTTARRLHHQHRCMLAGSSVEEICAQVEAALGNESGMTRSKSAPKIVFAFTGQGAQYPGMAKQLFESFSHFHTEMRRLDQIGQCMGFPSILPVIMSEEQDISVSPPTAVQLASVCMQIALSKLWASWDVRPIAVVSHSLGEYAARNVAGELSDADTIYLVGRRAELLQEMCTRDSHTMLVVKGSVEDIAAVLKNERYQLACVNSPLETVLAGPNERITTLKDLLTDSGMKSSFLKVPYAFHSSQVEPILSDYKKLASGVTFSKARILVLCPMNGDGVDRDFVLSPDYLAKHSREPVNMLKALLKARQDQIITDQTVVVEIGPHPAVCGMIKSALGPQVTTLPSLQRGRSTWHVLGAALKLLYNLGADISWGNYQRDFKGSHKVIPLPAYSWDLKEYWMQYVNDWSLRKGDPPLTIANTLSLESTTVHRVVEETGDSSKAQVVVEADITRKDLSPLVQGHEIDGVPLCTPSVYADIALTLGNYLLKRYRPDQQENLVDVSDMIISKALILRADASHQLLRACAEVDWQSKLAAIRFMSFDNKEKLQEHARCVVRFETRDLQQRLQRDSANTKRKIQALRDGIVTGATARFNRPMVYRAIRPLARFHDDYRAIDEIHLNSNTLEASSHLSFGSVKRGGKYHTHPAIIDSLTQSCGFTMNCNDKTDLDQEVFMNHGWGSFQIYEQMDLEKKYNTYTHMEEGEDKLWHGDVAIFDGDRIVSHIGQIAIQGVPRRVLKVILSLESGQKANKQQNAPVQRKETSTTAPASAKKVSQAAPIILEDSSALKSAKALSIVAEESGLALSDLTDSTVFADVGVDSLLGLTISARFKEELDMDLDFNALFFEFPTVGDLKAAFGKSMADRTASSPSPSSDTRSESLETTVTTPDPEEDISVSKVDFNRVLNIISEESGVGSEELTDDIDFADSGVDSLLSLVVVSRLRDELEIDIQHESLFLECPTVADLKNELCGDLTSKNTALPVAKSNPAADDTQEVVSDSSESRGLSQYSGSEKAALASRKKAVDSLVQKYAVEFSAPSSSPSATAPSATEKVILVTGASGSLGGHLVHHLAHLNNVKMVVCLNRENKAEPYVRQQKAMREKGIRSFDVIRSKLLVLQTDSAKPTFGLSSSEYEGLANSVTHLIHNAWPMTAKRPLAGFESQFKIMRNLMDFACDVASRRPMSFKFTFQMVSSVGVVGHYGLGKDDKRIMVPEESVDIDSVLPNGYGDAKWGCERMLEATLHKHPHRIRTMAVRLGQIAGSKISGYWNPMEHFGFLIKSSQTLNALPDVGGTVYWTPVNDIAGALSDLILSDRAPHAIYHIENPVGQPWPEVNAILADALDVPSLIPFDDWVERVRSAPQRGNPASQLLGFLDDNYLRMSCGGLVLDVKKTLEHSGTLRAVGPVSEEVIRKYVHIWKEIGFL